MDYKRKLIELLHDVSMWSELKQKLETLNTSKTDTTEKNTIAGKLFEYFAKYYFKVDATQSQLYTDVWLYDEIDSLTKEELGLPTKDKGVDLLLKDTHGRYTVVQCKFKNNEDSIVHFGKDKLANTFFWAKKCFGVILFTNVSDCTDDIKNEKNFNAIKSDTLLNLDSSIFTSILNYIELNVSIPAKKHEPLPHQELAIAKVTEHFKENARGQLILPCGAGKTTTSLWIREALNSKTTLVLFPSLALLRQFKTEWAEQRSSDYVYINVCSEKDIDKSRDDSPVMHTYEISGEVTTSPDRIKEFLESDFDYKIVFCTYQSIKVIENALLHLQAFYFDLIICDEAHRTAGGAKKNTFAIVHDQDKIRGRKRLYMTATPRVVSVQLKAKLGEDYALLCDMSNSEIYGAEAFRMSFGEAINQNILVDYKIIGIGVTQKQVKQFIEQRRFVTEEYDLKEIADNYALNLVMEKYSAFHAITFHSRVKLADEFSQRHNLYFGDNVYSNHVSGEDKTSKRADILRRFKNHTKGVVSNARCLTEGVDVPIIDLIYFCDPKNSKIDIVQASGRALRKDRHGKKPIGYIVVPIFHHIDEDIEKEIEKKPYFQNLIQVVRSLCDQDERLQAEIDEVAFNKGEKISRRIEITYDDNEIEKIITLDGLDKEVKKYLFDQIIEKTRDNWNVMYSNLVEFKKKYGTTNITRKQIEYNTLRWWIQAQRDNYFKKKLSQLQIDKLNKIGFEWKGEQRREITDRFEIWMQSYRKLQQYYADNGNSDIPARYKKDKGLANWLVAQRVRYDEATLSDEQIELLEKVHINWDPKNTYPQFIEGLEKYKSIFNHTKVPQGIYEYRKLAAKCSRVRTIFKNGKEGRNGDLIFSGIGRLTKWAIEKLNQLAFEWDVTSPEWDERFEELKEFYELYGYSNVKASDNQTLFYWTYKQRRNKDELTTEQIEKLKSLNFSFDLKRANNENIFLDKLIELKEYFEQTKNGVIEKDKSRIRKLQKWESALRVSFRKGELSQEKIDLLSKINFSFKEEDKGEQEWANKFNELKEFYNQNKTFVLPDSNDFRKLKNWIAYQRNLNRSEKLQSERREKFLALGYSFERNYFIPKTELIKRKKIENWNKKIVEYKEFILNNPTLPLHEEDVDNIDLWQWIQKVKLLYKHNRLSVEEIQQLQEAEFDFTIISTKPANRTISKSWLDKFESFKKYHSESGLFYFHKNIEVYKKLREWLNLQRTLFNRQFLSEEKINLFNSIGYSLSENYYPKVEKKPQTSFQQTWEQKFFELKNHFEKNNTFYIDHSKPENKSLHSWLRSQKQKYKNQVLEAERIIILEEIGFSFTTNYEGPPKPKKQKIIKLKKRDLEWNAKYLKLIDYKLKHGDCNVSKGYSDTTLGNWVSRQRYLRRLNKLSNEEINKLNLIEFRWDEVKRTSEFELWLKTYSKLKTFYDKKGHSSPQKSYGDKQLVSWVLQQRHRKRKGKLKSKYFDLLQEIKFNWNPNLSGGISKPKDDMWLNNYNQLLKYKEKFRNTNVSQTNKEYKALGKWVNDQRHNFKKGKMSEFRISKLNEVGFVWDARIGIGF